MLGWGITDKPGIDLWERHQPRSRRRWNHQPVDNLMECGLRG